MTLDSGGSVDPLKATTMRYCLRDSQLEYEGISPNLGLECYLGEAFLRSGQGAARLSIPSLIRLRSQAQLYDGFHFWGWEKRPSVPGVRFPLDWDDTSKAVDFISAYRSVRLESDTPFGIILPDSEMWSRLISWSIFESPKVGVEVKLDAISPVSLSVFFGSLASVWPTRDDPMVTVATVRTTALWYPHAYSRIQTVVKELLRRVAGVVEPVLSGRTTFSSISRYYFSIGHFVFRLLECLQICEISAGEVGVPVDMISEKILRECDRDLSGCPEPSLAEVKWWVLTGLLLGIVDGRRLMDRLFLTASPDVPIYRHRRLNHYYGAHGWLRRLQCWEYSRLKCSSEAGLPRTPAQDRVVV